MPSKTKQPRWVSTLRILIEARDFNPRSLSLKAGLNATAVRDILEGRAKYPRYDTVEALAKALEVKPSELMSGKAKDILSPKPSQAVEPAQSSLEEDDLELLTDIIGKLQQVATEYKQALKPKDFAAMVTTIFTHVQDAEINGKNNELSKPINHLMTYERLRKQGGNKG